MESPQRPLRAAVIVLVLLSALWGYSWIVMRMGMRHADPLTFAAMRGVLGSAALFLVLAVTGRPMRPYALKESIQLGMLQNGLFIGLTSWATLAGGAGKTSVLTFTMPFWTLILAWIGLGERIRGLQWVAVVLALVGLVTILEPWRLGDHMLPNLLALSAGVVWALATVMTKRMPRMSQFDPITFTAWQVLIGTFPLTLGALLTSSRPLDWGTELVVALLFNGIVATGAGWLMWLYVLKRLPAGTAGMSTLAVPVIAVLCAWLQLGEVPSRAELVGMLLIGAGLAVLSILGYIRHQRDNPLPPD